MSLTRLMWCSPDNKMARVHPSVGKQTHTHTHRNLLACAHFYTVCTISIPYWVNNISNSKRLCVLGKVCRSVIMGRKLQLCGLSWISLVGTYTVCRLYWQAYVSPNQNSLAQRSMSFSTWCNIGSIVTWVWHWFYFLSFFEPSDWWFRGK